MAKAKVRATHSSLILRRRYAGVAKSRVSVFGLTTVGLLLLTFALLHHGARRHLFSPFAITA